MTGQDVFKQMLQSGDLEKGYVPSGFNSEFIDQISAQFKQYVQRLSNSDRVHPPYLCEEAELFVTLFNVTGIRYSLFTKAAGKSGNQYVSEHRDIAHFGWHDTYKKNGRMELTFKKENMDKHLNVLINAAKATGAFPVGLRGRKLARKAKYIRDNPFFNYDGEFKPDDIYLGECAKNPEDVYLSINADGGTANNEPIELAGDVMEAIRKSKYKEEGEVAKNNSTVILIDPFPSLGTKVTRPPYHADNLIPDYASGLVGAMRSQLLFDAKKALDIYRKRNYGLHLIAPSNDKFDDAKNAIACGSLGGFGGLLCKEFRVHDYFLGRHNSQSFLRKYLSVRLDHDSTSDDYKKVQAVIDSYKKNPEAAKRFKYIDSKGVEWYPIIPDMEIKKGGDTNDRYNELPVYDLHKLPYNYMEQYRLSIKSRFSSIIGNIAKAPWWAKPLVWMGSGLSKGAAAKAVIAYVEKDFRLRKLMDGDATKDAPEKENCADRKPFEDM